MPKIVCRTPNGSQVFELTESSVVGRSTAADLVLDDQTVSRRHARFFLDGQSWYVEDAGSGNGTVLNGVVIRAATALSHGDELLLGKSEVRFEHTEPLGIQATTIVESEGKREHLQVMDVSPTPGHTSLNETLRLQLVADAASAIARAQDEALLFQIVSERLFAIFRQAERTCIITIDEQSGVLQPRLALTRSGAVEKVPVSRALLDEVIRLRCGIVSADASRDSRFSRSGSVAKLDICTVVCAPIVAGDVVLGVIQIDSSEGAWPFTDVDLATLLALASVTGMALANQRINRVVAVQLLLSQDLALAKRIQRHFFPDSPPSIPGFAFDTEYSPALGVGGDYYDFIHLSGHHCAVIIADVSGKGISAALYMVKLSSEVRFHATGNVDAAAILRRVNKAMLSELTDGMFITMLLIVLDTTTGKLQIASAGHMAPLVRHANGEISILPVPQNEPLGMPNYGGFEEATFQVAPGDVVVMFTDGVSEGMNRSRELFREQRLRQAVERAEGTPSDVKKRILADLEAFCDGADQNDDITLICFGPIAR